VPQELLPAEGHNSFPTFIGDPDVIRFERPLEPLTRKRKTTTSVWSEDTRTSGLLQPKVQRREEKQFHFQVLIISYFNLWTSIDCLLEEHGQSEESQNPIEDSNDNDHK
jgi:hypothetical protein